MTPVTDDVYSDIVAICDHTSEMTYSSLSNNICEQVRVHGLSDAYAAVSIVSNMVNSFCFNLQNQTSHLDELCSWALRQRSFV